MDKNREIEEMARDMCGFSGCLICSECSDDCQYYLFANRLYKKGYLKQSEGEWICNRQTSEYICSLCGAIGPVDCLKEDFYESNFCPNCGARMKGEQDDNL